jgi:hypothetical protein
MAKAVLLARSRVDFDDGGVLETKLWRLPQPTLERPHGLKYSLYYGKNGIRQVGYDNERGKGDHRHFGECEEAYVFVDVDTLLRDFLTDVQRARGTK